MELVGFALIVVAAAAIGIWLGMLAAPRIGRLVERHEEEPDARDGTSEPRDDEGDA